MHDLYFTMMDFYLCLAEKNVFLNANQML